MHALLAGMEKLSERLARSAGAAAAVLVFVLMLLIVADVAARTVFNSPILGALEISEQIMSYVVFLSLGYGLLVGAHVRVSLGVQLLGPRLRRVAAVFALLLGACTFAALLPAGWRLFYSSWEVREAMPAVVPIPFWTAKFALPFGLFVMTVQFVALALPYLTGRRGSNASLDQVPDREAGGSRH